MTHPRAFPTQRFRRGLYGWGDPRVKIREDELFESLHDKYNTVTVALQNPTAFHADVRDAARRAEDTEHFHRIMEETCKKRRDEILEGINGILERFMRPGLRSMNVVGPGKEGYGALHDILRYRSLDSIFLFISRFYEQFSRRINWEPMPMWTWDEQDRQAPAWTEEDTEKLDITPGTPSTCGAQIDEYASDWDGQDLDDFIDYVNEAFASAASRSPSPAPPRQEAHPAQDPNAAGSAKRKTQNESPRDLDSEEVLDKINSATIEPSPVQTRPRPQPLIPSKDETEINAYETNEKYEKHEIDETRKIYASILPHEEDAGLLAAKATRTNKQTQERQATCQESRKRKRTEAGDGEGKTEDTERIKTQDGTESYTDILSRPPPVDSQSNESNEEGGPASDLPEECRSDRKRQRTSLKH